MNRAQAARVALLRLLAVVAAAFLLSLGGCTAQEFSNVAQGIGSILGAAFIVGMAVVYLRDRRRK